MRSLETRDGWQVQPNPSLYTSILATEWLAVRAGDSSYVDYWRELADSATWQEAFAAAFGISIEDFYEAFEEHRRELFADLRQIRGVVLGADGETLEGVGLLAWQGARGRKRGGGHRAGRLICHPGPGRHLYAADLRR